MREEYLKQLRKDFLKTGIIAGIILTAILAAVQSLFWFVEDKKRTSVVGYTRGMSTYVCMVMACIIVLFIVMLQISAKASYLNQFYINRSVIAKVKRLSLSTNSLLFGIITLIFQALYVSGQYENVGVILLLQFVVNILFTMAIVVWADNAAMYSTWISGLYITVLCVLVIHNIITDKYRVYFMVTDWKISLILITGLALATMIGLFINEKLTKKEDCVKGVEANE